MSLIKYLILNIIQLLKFFVNEINAHTHSLLSSAVKSNVNIAFTALTLISLLLLTTTAPETALPVMLEGVRSAILLILKLTAIYAVWMSVLKMFQACELDKKLSKLLRPIIKRLFKNESEEAYGWISVNLASNMLGMGGATTPAGINAMTAMCREEGKATDNMLLLLVINATSIQIIPATVISLRAAAGSANAASVFFPTLIATTVSTLTGSILCKLFSGRKETRVLPNFKMCTLIKGIKALDNRRSDTKHKTMQSKTEIKKA